jgi:hypothetical protein
VFGSSFIDDLTYIGDVEVCMECVICDIPGSICYGSEDKVCFVFSPLSSVTFLIQPSIRRDIIINVH